MRNVTVCSLVLMTLAAVTAAYSRQETENPDEQRIREIEAATAKGEQQNDVSMMGLYAEGFLFSGKKVISKEQLEKNVKDNFVAHDNGPSPFTIDKKNMQIYLFGDVAVVTYIKEYRQTRDTTRFFAEDETDVFKRAPHGWLIQFSKSSPAASNPSM
jgi:ketosteroid isomerase-like protein